jgi:hypothetical protein
MNEYFKKKKQELIQLYLDKIKILKIAEDVAVDYVQVIIESLKTICGTLMSQGPFTSCYCLLELYHQIVSCVYGNEKLSKVKLGKRRGYGLNAEMFTQELQLSALGLKLAYPFLKHISVFFAGAAKKECVSLIFACLYYKEVNTLQEEVICTEVQENMAGLVKSYAGCLSDGNTPGKEYGSVSLPYFINVFCRKYRRNEIKRIAAKIFKEIWIDSRGFQEKLCSHGLMLYISHNGQDFQFNSTCLNSTLASLKKWLRAVTGQELASMWYQYAIKKFALSENDEFAIMDNSC